MLVGLVSVLYKNDMEHLKKIQRKFTRLLPGLKEKQLKIHDCGR